MGRKLTRVCIDCGGRLKNRSKTTKRCNACWRVSQKIHATGRKIGMFCKVCNKELSLKKTTSFMCLTCYRNNPLPAWNKNKKGMVPWNKGKSLFKDKTEYAIHMNHLRRIRYHKSSVKCRIADRIRTLVRNCIRNKATTRKKDSKTVELIGCEINFFINYLEQLFEPWMNWTNYGNGIGKWNIDHIIPISRFNLNKIEEQKKAFHFTNCRPMCSIANIKKGNK